MIYIYNTYCVHNDGWDFCYVAYRDQTQTQTKDSFPCMYVYTVYYGSILLDSDYEKLGSGWLLVKLIHFDNSLLLL